MKKILFTALSLAVAMSLDAKVFATVDGKDITDVDLTPMLAGMPGVNFEALPAELQNQVIDKAIDLRLLINEAKKNGIEYVDERLTTISATRVLIEQNVSRKKRKDVIDSVAATYILQTYLDMGR